MSLSIFMISLVLALCAQTEGANLRVALDADGPFTRTQPTSLILTAENDGVVALDDVDLALELASDDAGIGVAPGCDESDDGERQTLTCAIGSLPRSTSVSLRVNVVPNEEGDLRVALRGTTSTIGEDIADNAIESVFAVARFVPPAGDGGGGDDRADGCAACSPVSFAGSLCALVALRMRTRRRERRHASP